MRYLIRNNDFPKAVGIFCFLLSLFFRKTENSFVSCVVGFYRWQSQHIAAQSSQKFNIVASSEAFVAKAGIDCDHWCPYVVRHIALLCLQLEHV